MTKQLFIFFIFVLLFNLTFGCDGPDADTSLLKWSDPASWPNGQLPTAGSFVTISNGILLDISPPEFQQIRIKSTGKLVFSSKNGPLELVTGGLLIEGRLDIGNDGCRFTESATITLTGIDGKGYYETQYDLGRKFIGVLPGGRLELHGYLAYPIPSWVNLNVTAPAGTSLITLNQDVSGWPVGSQIVVGATDFDYTQSEENVIVACPTCASNQLQLKTPLQWYHYGAITYGVDQRAEVGLLTKNIKIQGRMQAACNGSALCKFFDFDTLGGHLRVILGFGSVHIQGAEFYKMGQTYNLGTYPIHFHMCGDVDTGDYASWPTFIKDNSIHHTLSRCLTIHGTSGLIVVNNFAFDAIGHCYFFEDASEQRNYLDSNVGLLTRAGYLLPSDRTCELCLYLAPTDFNGNPTSCGECQAVATFWVTNPNNILKNNVAGGSINAGFWYLFPEGASGLSQALYPDIAPKYTALGVFSNNKAHSNVDVGMNVDQAHQIVHPNAQNPQQYLSMTIQRWKPRVDPTNPDSARSTAYFYRFISYKNKWRGLWARGGDMVFVNSQFADNAIGVTLASEGVMPADPGSSQQIIGSTFVGESENVGAPYNGINMYKGHTIPAWQEYNQKGFEVYDGPVSVSYSTFVNYNSDGVRNMSGIGWFLYDDWILNPKSKTFGLSFVNSNTRVYTYLTNDDGSKNEIIHDEDGSLTGTSGASLVPNVPYFYSPKCVANTQWNKTVCYEKFSSIYVYNMDLANTITPSGTSGIVMIRDQYSFYRHVMYGVPNSTPRNTFMPLVMIGRTYTMHFLHPSPPNLRLQMTNFDQGDSVVVGVCYPKYGVSFSVKRNVVLGWQTFATTMVSGKTIDAVNNDATGMTYFYDATTGLLFIKFIQQGSRTWSMYCPDTGCESVNIIASGWAVGTNSGDCSADAYGTGLYVKKDYATRGGCNGVPTLTVDECGVCGGNGTTCSEVKSAGGTASNNNNVGTNAAPSSTTNSFYSQFGFVFISTILSFLLYFIIF
ncbi:transmembrane protein [Cavenderia fasciculata]|uniref:Transmembrane protein n=1 Tax=Cavenderia fasciculata TaxID=261658 RepID=F4Q020_CACFS|nr:uncharacterized protein DFA_02674 [Cavenderia fasciculata]EGG18934.1 transmembrane protein [Cavenderia fasciculata]|eukprot:XP_004357396.1 transmembrane protein [Cavenderia fasciculata]